MKFFKFCCLLLIIASCQSPKDVKSMTDGELRAYADELAHRFIISDGHVDLPYRLKENKWVVDEGIIGGMGKPVGDFDDNRAKKGGLDAPSMSIYIPSSYQKKNDKGELLGGGKELA